MDFQRKYLLWILAGACVFFGGCTKSGSMPIPTYIHIDSFHFKKNASQPMDSLTAVNAVRVYYNNISVGEFDLPATVPIVADGTGKLVLAPAVAVNGRNDIETVYPYYVPDTSTLIASPGKTINYTPTVSYYANLQVYHLESFTPIAGTPIMEAPTALKYNCGTTKSIILTTSGDSSFSSSTYRFTLSVSNNFIEFDYLCTIPFTISIQANLGGSPIGAITSLTGIYPGNRWKKFYLSVSDYAIKMAGTSYTLYIEAGLPQGQTNGMVLFANMNVLSFR